MGTCGAATGVGIGFSVLFKATPLTPKGRHKAQSAAAQVLTRIAALQAGRCCQRETYIALQEAAALTEALLGKPLRAGGELVCSQYGDNRECVRRQCPLWETRKQGMVPSLVTLPML